MKSSTKFRSQYTYLFLVGIVILIGCSTQTDYGEKADTADVPPSLRSQEETLKNTNVNLTENQKNQLNIQTVTLRPDNFTYALTLPGMTFPAPDNYAIVSAPISGRIVSLRANEGEYVKKGQVLFEIESLEFANMVADFMQSSADENYLAIQYDRIETLVEKGISPERAIEKADADLARAKALVQAASARLTSIGVKQAEMQEWLGGENSQPRLKIYANISGTISEHLIDLGQAVQINEKLLTIVDLSQVLVRGYAAPEDGDFIKAGDPVSITLKDYPDKRLKGEVATINPSLDEQNRSISINTFLDTPDGWPKPGQNVRLQISVKTSSPVISVPLSAIQYEGELPLVFIQKDPLNYEKRPIKIRRLTSNAAIISEGLEGGERVAINQVFSLKALGKYEEFAE